VDEFWEMEEPKEFRLLASEQADWRKFKRWIRSHLRSIEGTDFDYDKIAMEKYGNVGICLGDYDEKSEINTDMAVFKWNNTMFLSEEELKKVPEDKLPKPLVPPTMPDLSTCERVFIDKNDLKVNEIQAEQEKLSDFI